MAKRRLNPLQILQTFEGNDMEFTEMEGENKVTKPFTVKRGLLHYCRIGNRMGLTESDLDDAYGLGRKLGEAQGEIVLTKGEYKLAVKMCDKNKIIGANGQEEPIWNLDVVKQIAAILEAAPDVPEESDIPVTRMAQPTEPDATP